VETAEPLTVTSTNSESFLGRAAPRKLS